jgi:hypothetical protein
MRMTAAGEQARRGGGGGEVEMTFFIPPNICLLFFRDPQANFTPERLKQLLGDRGATVTGDEQPYAVRWRDGPTLYVSIIRGEVAEILAGRLMGRGRKYRDLIPGCDTYVEITFQSLDEVLDEINTLIDVQATLQEAAGGLMYRSWNQTFSGPED